MPCPQCGYSSDKKNRSNNQNRYMWGVVYRLIADHTGYATDEVHELMKHKFLGRLLSISDEKILITHSTTELNTTQMEDYLKNILEWASVKLGVFIPEPNEELIEQ